MQLFTRYEKCYSLLNSEDRFNVNKKTEWCKWLDAGIFHSVHWGINPPPIKKQSFLPSPPLNWQTVQADQLFLSLSILDSNLFFMWKLQPTPPEKSHPLFLSNPCLKVEVLPAPPFLKIWLGVQPSLPCKKRRGAHYVFYVWVMHWSKIILIFTSNGQGVVGWI